MVPDQCQELHEMILGHMVDVAFDKKTKKNNDDRNETNIEEEPTGAGSSDGIDFAFEGLYDHSNNDDDSTTLAGTNINEEGIQIRCNHQLAAYKLSAPMKMRDNEGIFNDALKHWAVNESQSPELAKLAKEFLTIPATSASSERVRLRAARIIRVSQPRGYGTDDVCSRKF